MPRTGKGGSRQGGVGDAYGNRTDLNGSMPVTVAKNQEYGKATEQRAAQNAIPMGSTPTAPAAQAPSPARTLLGNMPSSQGPAVAPGSSPFLHPTSRPDEPIQAGISSGPGPGPEALGQPQNAVSNALSGLAAMPGASLGLIDLAASARLLGL